METLSQKVEHIPLFAVTVRDYDLTDGDAWTPTPNPCFGVYDNYVEAVEQVKTSYGIRSYYKEVSIDFVRDLCKGIYLAHEMYYAYIDREGNIASIEGVDITLVHYTREV